MEPLFTPDFKSSVLAYFGPKYPNLEVMKNMFLLSLKRGLPGTLVGAGRSEGDYQFLCSNPTFTSFLSECWGLGPSSGSGKAGVDDLIANYKRIHLDLPGHVAWGNRDDVLPMWSELTPIVRTHLLIQAARCGHHDLFYELVATGESFDELVVLKECILYRLRLQSVLARLTLNDKLYFQLLALENEEILDFILQYVPNRPLKAPEFEALNPKVQYKIVQAHPNLDNLKQCALQIYTSKWLDSDLIKFLVSNLEALTIFLDHLEKNYYDQYAKQLAIRDKYTAWINSLMNVAPPDIKQFIQTRVHRDQYKIDRGYSKQYVDIWRPNRTSSE